MIGAMKTLLPFALGLVTGCAAYQPGSFSDYMGPFPGTQARVGCLDVAVELVPDTLATGAVARFALGNRCNQPTAVNFDLVVARRLGDRGEWIYIAATDPKNELRPLTLSPCNAVVELFEFVLPEQSQGDLCLEISQINGPGGGPPNEFCLEPLQTETI